MIISPHSCYLMSADIPFLPLKQTPGSSAANTPSVSIFLSACRGGLYGASPPQAAANGLACGYHLCAPKGRVEGVYFCVADE